MANVLINEDTLQDIANKARALSGSDEPMTMNEASESLDNTKQALDTTLEEIKTSVNNIPVLPLSSIKDYTKDKYETGILYSESNGMISICVDKDSNLPVGFMLTESTSRNINLYAKNEENVAKRVTWISINAGCILFIANKNNVVFVTMSDGGYVAIQYSDDGSYVYEKEDNVTQFQLNQITRHSYDIFKEHEIGKFTFDIDSFENDYYKNRYVNFYYTDKNVTFKVGDDESDVVTVHKEDQILRVFKSDTELVIVGDVYIYTKDLTNNPSKTVVRKLWDEDVDTAKQELDSIIPKKLSDLSPEYVTEALSSLFLKLTSEDFTDSGDGWYTYQQSYTESSHSWLADLSSVKLVVAYNNTEKILDRSTLNINCNIDKYHNTTWLVDEDQTIQLTVNKDNSSNQFWNIKIIGDIKNGDNCTIELYHVDTNTPASLGNDVPFGRNRIENCLICNKYFAVNYGTEVLYNEFRNDTINTLDLIPGEKYVLTVNGVPRTLTCLSVDDNNLDSKYGEWVLPFEEEYTISNKQVGECCYKDYDNTIKTYNYGSIVNNRCSLTGPVYITKRIGVEYYNNLNGKSGNGGWTSFSAAESTEHGVNSFECNESSATGKDSHAEGYKAKASGYNSHAEGYETTASGRGSHAEGYDTQASGAYSHAEGDMSVASGDRSHAEGSGAKSSGAYSHAEGGYTTASGECSHAEGYNTKASSDYQHVQGKYNIENTANKYAHIVGNGTSLSKRSNAHVLDWDGNSEYKGDVIAKSPCDGTKSDEQVSLADTRAKIDQFDLSHYVTIDGSTKKIDLEQVGVESESTIDNQTYKSYRFHKVLINQDSNITGYVTIVCKDLESNIYINAPFVELSLNYSEFTNKIDIYYYDSEGYKYRSVVTSEGSTDTTYGRYTTDKEVLKLDNKIEYDPTENYHPATKKYVDDRVTALEDSVLPTVTAEDNGKILQVVDGKWALVSPDSITG